MLGAFVDFLNNANGAAKRLKREYPKEEIVFASAVTILETTETSPVGWSFKRFLQRRGVAVFSQDSVDPIFIVEARPVRRSPGRSHNDLPRHGE